ncbi:MAG: RNA-protein complex protein Nop10 [Archaeoglobaceae archaeon]
MKLRMRKCRECGAYTLEEVCPKCGAGTFIPVPPRFSPQDPYGKYRRKFRKEKGFFSTRR